MRRSSTVIALTGLGLALALARPVAADIAPMPASVSHMPVPKADAALRELLANGRFGLELATRDAGSGVRLSAETVELDLYPELLWVRVHFELEAGADARGPLIVGFPEAVPGLDLAPLEGLHVEVDGVPTATGYRGAWVNGHDLRALDEGREPAASDDHFRVKSWGRSSWRTWALDIEPGATRSVDVEYVQMHEIRSTRDTAEIMTGYILRSGARWDGAIGSADVNLRWHDLDDASVEILGESKDDPWAHAETSRGPTHVSWSLANFEPERDLVVRVMLPVPLAPTLEPDDEDTPAIVDLLRSVARTVNRSDVTAAEITTLVKRLHAASRLPGMHAAAAHDALLALDRAVYECVGDDEDTPPCSLEVDTGLPFGLGTTLTRPEYDALLTAARSWLLEVEPSALPEHGGTAYLDPACGRPSADVVLERALPQACRRSWLVGSIDPHLFEGYEAPPEEDPESSVPYTPPLVAAILSAQRRRSFGRPIRTAALVTLVLAIGGLAIWTFRRRQARANQ